jgi:hypothetical protein
LFFLIAQYQYCQASLLAHIQKAVAQPGSFGISSNHAVRSHVLIELKGQQPVGKYHLSI